MDCKARIYAVLDQAREKSVAGAGYQNTVGGMRQAYQGSRRLIRRVY